MYLSNRLYTAVEVRYMQAYCLNLLLLHWTVFNERSHFVPYETADEAKEKNGTANKMYNVHNKLNIHRI